MNSQDIKQKATRLGYASCGIIPAAPFDEYKKYVEERCLTFPQSRSHYEWLNDFAQLPEGAKSVIVCIRRYNKYKVPQGLDKWVGKNYLFDGRVPYSHEYRDKAEFEAYLKTGGIGIIDFEVPARWAAAKAGLGKFGRNCFVYDPDHGSYHYIYAWVVDKALDYDEEPEDLLMPECSDDCEKCVEACPTNALVGGLSMDMDRCAARLTCYSGSGLPPDEATRLQMGELLYGCDFCQDACPVNRDKFVEEEEFPLLDQYMQILPPERILELGEDTYLSVLNPRFWYARDEGLWLWKFNALRAMINSGDEAYHDIIKRYCDHEDERLNEIARLGCKQLGL